MDGWIDPPPLALAREHGVSIFFTFLQNFTNPHQIWGVFSPSYSPPAPNHPRCPERYFHFGSKTYPRVSKSSPEAIQNRITFSLSFFDGFGSNLAPTWSQLVPNLEPKSFQNPSQEPSKTHPKSHHILNDFLDGFWMHFWSPKLQKINKKSNTNSTQQHNNHSIEKPINLVTVLLFL